jgi:hypothetical protein
VPGWAQSRAICRAREMSQSGKSAELGDFLCIIRTAEIITHLINQNKCSIQDFCCFCLAQPAAPTILNNKSLDETSETGFFSFRELLGYVNKTSFFIPLKTRFLYASRKIPQDA